jgi:hypothetical protein
VKAAVPQGLLSHLWKQVSDGGSDARKGEFEALEKISIEKNCNLRVQKRS